MGMGKGTGYYRFGGTGRGRVYGKDFLGFGNFTYIYMLVPGYEVGRSWEVLGGPGRDRLGRSSDAMRCFSCNACMDAWMDGGLGWFSFAVYAVFG
ncbi:predicted protein [Sclerotinia sclerotiorum 1980 UF-70]|uniref:Uncharacterized protein n=1 Tax=Sclerotinia sclerotiorum (strain ATCC 18683 / 1980 / Ss-1) TaxID=665079 RepID=A7EYG2_SCLS1|nr:predicted protein [Sclerotinia sclerotiorum 1980 UF-70]EDN94504.1 predicted protein [Sclerotinia sclerotiorum 1980 UF-70]